MSSEVRTWGVVAHAGGLAIGLLSLAALGFLAPLIVWALKKEEHPFLDHHAKEALNFQLTVLVALIASVVLAIPALILGVLTLGLGLVLIAVVVVAAIIAWFVLPIVAAIAASRGDGYRYPLTIRFVR
ncbi:MAG: DUF4870 domain-containing protein [Nitriliruptoraceae bacterium]|nr:DUF4870 domain-containing protein [Nitriliruptoraceae bacterium]